MKNSLTHQITLFFRFMRLFSVSLFSITKVTPENIHAIVAWEDDCRKGIPDIEDTQEVLWMLDINAATDDAITLGEYAKEHGWISSDRIKMNEAQMQHDLDWNSSRLSKAIQKLFQLRVQMIENGYEEDSFFFHK